MLENWKNYLSEEDYNKLIFFVQCVIDNTPFNGFLIITGGPSTGKTQLLHDIIDLVGINNAENMPQISDLLTNNKKLYYIQRSIQKFITYQ